MCQGVTGGMCQGVTGGNVSGRDGGRNVSGRDGGGDEMHQTCTVLIRGVRIHNT